MTSVKCSCWEVLLLEDSLHYMCYCVHISWRKIIFLKRKKVNVLSIPLVQTILIWCNLARSKWDSNCQWRCSWNHNSLLISIIQRWRQVHCMWSCCESEWICTITIKKERKVLLIWQIFGINCLQASTKVWVIVTAKLDSFSLTFSKSETMYYHWWLSFIITA